MKLERTNELCIKLTSKYISLLLNSIIHKLELSFPVTEAKSVVSWKVRTAIKYIAKRKYNILFGLINLVKVQTLRKVKTPYPIEAKLAKCIKNSAVSLLTRGF
ncbi:MAG: hypothetical protein ACOCYF_02285 [Bacteroidota bacterium]